MIGKLSIKYNMKSYDKIPENEDILLDLPFREASGVVTLDHAKPHHAMTLNDPGGGSFSWDALATGLGTLTFVTIGGGASDGVYIDSPAVDSTDLDFTNDDYSICGWINWQSDGQSEIIIGRYGTNLDGWDCFLNAGSSSLTLRHNHSSLTPNNSSQCFSAGWTVGSWDFFSISRLGANLYPLMYRNAVALEMNYEATGMLDPDTCNRDVVIGCRNTKDANWFKGGLQGLRVWDRALSAAEWMQIYNKEVNYFAT